MSVLFEIKKLPYLMGSLFAITFIATLLRPPVSAKPSGSPVEQLPVQEQAALREGEVTITGQDGQYTGRVLVNAPVSIAWNVLTDYGDYEQFFPSVAESHLIRSEGNYHVFEQINVVRVFLFTNRSRVVIAATESYPKKIDFQLVEGDLKSLQGVWRFEPVASDDGGSPMQVLVTHQVAVAPKSSSSRSLFLRVYQNNIQDTLAALKQELEWRSQQQSHRSN